jgi:hypothetical protein
MACSLGEMYFIRNEIHLLACIPSRTREGVRSKRFRGIRKESKITARMKMGGENHELKRSREERCSERGGRRRRGGSSGEMGGGIQIILPDAYTLFRVLCTHTMQPAYMDSHIGTMTV